MVFPQDDAVDRRANKGLLITSTGLIQPGFCQRHVCFSPGEVFLSRRMIKHCIVLSSLVVAGLCHVELSLVAVHLFAGDDLCSVKLPAALIWGEGVSKDALSFIEGGESSPPLFGASTVDNLAEVRLFLRQVSFGGRHPSLIIIVLEDSKQLTAPNVVALFVQN